MTELDSKVYLVASAWNDLAFTEAKLGNDQAALTDSERALALQPRLVQAVENRGEAFLKLNRVEDAKQQYLDLYPAQPKLAKLLLSAMKSWIREQRRSSASANAAAVDALERWVGEREAIAQQTASR